MSTEAYTIFNHMPRVHQDLNNTDRRMTGLDIYFLYVTQSGSFAQYQSLCTRRHMNLYHRYTCSILCAYTSCLLVRVRQKNGLLSDFAPLHDGSVVSVHMTLQIVMLTVVLSLRGVTDRQAPCEDISR